MMAGSQMKVRKGMRGGSKKKGSSSKKKGY